MSASHRLGAAAIAIPLALAGCDTPVMAPAGGAPDRILANLSAAQLTSATIFTHASRGPVTVVEGARATLETNDAGARMTFQTRGLQPNHAYTTWWVLFNRPENCATTPCTAADVLFNTAAVEGEIAYATGHVVGGSGRGTFAARVSTGAVERGWYGNGFTNPRGAEIHLVLMDHGPAIPALVADQISTLRGGCTNQSVPAAFPPVAHADGIPGPNTCRLWQFAILVQ
jgi:hypothetical protein